MADTRILSRNGRSVTYMADEDGKTRVGTYADVSDVVESIQARRGMGMEKQVLGVMQCQIPLTTLDAWAKKISNGMLNAFDVADDDALLDRFMSEHGKFKVAGGWE